MIKIICVSTNDPRYDCKADITDIEDHYRSEICSFFPSIQRLGREKSRNYRMEIGKRCQNGNHRIYQKIQRRFKKRLEKCTKSVIIF